MLPTIDDISIKNVVKIELRNTLSDAISLMALNNVRNVIIYDNTIKPTKYYILTTKELIKLKLNHIAPNIALDKLDLDEIQSLSPDLSILSVMNHISSIDEHMVVLDPQNSELVGIVAYSDILNNIDPKVLMEKRTIGSLMMQYKPSSTYENISTLNAIEIMQENGSDSVIILDQDYKPKGIFTTKDFITIINDESCLQQPVSKYMSTPIETISVDSTIADALDFIQERKFKRLIVLDDEGLVNGLITQKELLRLVYNKWIDIIKEQGDKISKENEKLIQKTTQLQNKVNYDFLTKVYNRQKFESFLEYETLQVHRYKERNLSLIIIDIDDFKVVNDTYGHLTGDKVIKGIAEILTLCSRESDIVARWGGEEFVIMLPETNLEQAILVAQKLRSTIQNHTFENSLKVTVSLGISQYHKKDEAKDFFKRADEALYKAKELWKNRVEIEDIN